MCKHDARFIVDDIYGSLMIKFKYNNLGVPLHYKFTWVVKFLFDLECGYRSYDI